MLSAPMGNFQGPFRNINNCLEHGFPFIYWRIAKLGSYLTAYSCVLRSSQKWCYIHATGPQRSLRWLVFKRAATNREEARGKNGKETAQAVPTKAFSLVHYLRPGSDWIFQNEELDFINYSKETKARLLTHNNQPYKARHVNHYQFTDWQISYSNFLFVIQSTFFLISRHLRK